MQGLSECWKEIEIKLSKNFGIRTGFAVEFAS